MDKTSFFSALSLVSVFINVLIGVYTFKLNTKFMVNRVFCSCVAVTLYGHLLIL